MDIFTFNWEKLCKAAEYRPRRIITFIEALATGNTVPKNNYDVRKVLYGENWEGQSFLAYPITFLEHTFKHTDKDLVYYLALASARSLAEYKRCGIVTLPLKVAKFHPKDKISDSTLYSVTDTGLINFRYEVPLQCL